MPEIDTDLFQVLVLALLAIAVLILVAALSSLSSIRKLLKNQGSLGQAPLLESVPGALDTDVASKILEDDDLALEEPGSSWNDGLVSDPVASESAEAAEQIVEPATAGIEPGWDAAAVGDSWDQDLEPAAETRTDVGDAAGTEDGAAPIDPFTGEAVGAGSDAVAETDEHPFMRDAGDSAPQSTLDEPEEQPFERNGRWYFRRDDELLVYEEGTGEWVAAEEPERNVQGSWGGALASSGEGLAATSASVDESVGGGDAETDLQPEPDLQPDADLQPEPDLQPETDLEPEVAETSRFETVQPAEEKAEQKPVGEGGFWKCSSCGAVNGSSAATCRMCFSARP